MELTPIIEEKVFFAEGTLSGILGYPAQGAPRRCVLLCSPHPNFAGDMSNNVLEALAKHFSADSVTLRFNYRGVGQSRIDLPEGISVLDYWDRVEREKDFADALDDAAAAAQMLLRSAPGLQLAVVGYSFGAVIGLRLGLGMAEAGVLVGISPPMGRVNFEFLAGCPKPCLLLSGKDDFVFQAQEAAKLGDLGGSKLRMTLIDGSDHFFRGQERPLAQKVGKFVCDPISQMKPQCVYNEPSLVPMSNDLNVNFSEHIEELHEIEQYFFDPDTVGKLADLAQGFDHPCCLCTPALGVELEKRKVAATVLDIDERFSRVKGYQKYDIYQPKQLGMKFGIIICDFPFFSFPLPQQLSAIRLLAQDDFQQPLLICYLAVGSQNIVSTFAPFGIKPTGFRPGYVTVETSEIECFSNIDDGRLQALRR